MTVLDAQFWVSRRQDNRYIVSRCVFNKDKSNNGLAPKCSSRVHVISKGPATAMSMDVGATDWPMHAYKLSLKSPPEVKP